MKSGHHSLPAALAKGSAPTDTGSGVYPSLGNPLSGPAPMAGSAAGKTSRPPMPEKGRAAKPRPAKALPGHRGTPTMRDCHQDKTPIKSRPIG
jgi:hypothetical protein